MDVDFVSAYLYKAPLHSKAHCAAYKKNAAAPKAGASSGVGSSSSTSKPAPARKEAERAEGTSSQPMPAQDGVGRKRSSNPPSPESKAKGAPAASKGGGSKAPTSPNVTTKEQARQACVSAYKSMLIANPTDAKAALDAAHAELHKHDGVDGIRAATKGPHVKVLVDAGLGTTSSTEEPDSIKTGAGTARAYFIPTWAPSNKKRKRVRIVDDDSD